MAFRNFDPASVVQINDEDKPIFLSGPEWRADRTLIAYDDEAYTVFDYTRLSREPEP